MPEAITFRGAHIRYFDGRQEEGGAFVRVHMTADLSTPVMESMEWDDPGPSVTEAKLDGELHATHLILTPGDKMLRDREIQFDIRTVEDFKMVRVKAGEDSTRRELRFVARSSAPGVAAMIDDYIRIIGEHQGVCRVSYVKQEELPLEKPKSGPSTGTDDRQTVIDKALASGKNTGSTNCNAGIPLIEGEGKHDNGMKCTATVPVPTMAERKKAKAEEERKKREAREKGPSTGEEELVAQEQTAGAVQ